MIKRLLALLLVISLFPDPQLHAEATVPPPRDKTWSGNLTLEEALSIALRQNPDIRRAIQEIERTRGQVIEVRARALPHITATGSYTHQDLNLIEGGSSGGQSRSRSSDLGSLLGGTDGTGAAIDAQRLGEIFGGQGNEQQQGNFGGVNDKSWRVAIEVRQALYAGGQIRAALKIARFTDDSSYWSLRDVVDRVVSKVRTQFALILLNRALITVQEESIQLLSNQLKDQQNRFEAGTVPRFNVLQAEVALSNVRPELFRARNSYMISMLELARSLGIAPGPDGKPSFHCVGQLSLPIRRFSLTSALQLAKERRPFLKVQRQNILIETEQIKVAMAGYKPRLDANAGYEVRNSRLSDDLGETVNGWFFGVTGRWEIFDGLATYGKTKQTKARLESAKVNYDDSVLQVELEVQQAHGLLQQATETIESQRKGTEQAIESLRLASERLSAGAGTQLEVLDARVALTRARITELQARADYSTALAEFDRATATDTVYDDTFHDPLAVRVKKSVGKRKPLKTKTAPARPQQPDSKAANRP